MNKDQGASANAEPGSQATPGDASSAAPPIGFDPARRPMAALAQIELELRLSEQVFRQYGLQHLDKAEAARDDPREYNVRMKKAYCNTARADSCKRALAFFEAQGGIDGYRAIAAGSRRAKTPKAVEYEASQSGRNGIAQGPSQ